MRHVVYSSIYAHNSREGKIGFIPDKGEASNNSLLILSEFSIDEISIRRSLDYPPYLIRLRGKKTSLNFAEGKINFKRYEETIAKVCVSGFLTA